LSFEIISKSLISRHGNSQVLINIAPKIENYLKQHPIDFCGVVF